MDLHGDAPSANDDLKELRENWLNTEKATGRSLLASLILMGVFELLSKAAVEKLSVAGFEVKDLSFVRNALPVIIAYLFYEMACHAALRANYEITHEKMMSSVDKDLRDSNLDYFLRPARHPIFGPHQFKESKLAQRASRLFMPAFTLGIISFEAYAYKIGFTTLGVSSPVLWCSLIISIYQILLAVVILIYSRHDRAQLAEAWERASSSLCGSGSRETA
jgi:hypothetical protein